MQINIKKYNTKQEMYQHINHQLQELLQQTNDPISNLSNTTALLNLYLQDINWVGFYLLKNGKLLLGPFQGKPAVPTIQPGQGVCGTAVLQKTPQRIDDVHKCTNHIACDIASSSEIVIPIIKNDKVLGVLDIDSPIPSRFDQTDQDGLQTIINTLTNAIH